MTALNELLTWASRLEGDSVEVRGIKHDSRVVEPGDLFVAIPGLTLDGTQFAYDAVRRGASAVATERPIEDLGVSQLITANARRFLGMASHCIYGDPTRALDTLGVTGTNGKTTTTWLIDEALRALGRTPAMMGTIVTRGPGVSEVSAFTTPEADAIARFARRVVDAGADSLAMEVSSHALTLHRVDGIRFRVAAFTNLTQDHLDLHGTMDAYFAAKARLFRDLAPDRAVLRVDDPCGATLHGELGSRALSVSRLDAHADVFANDVVCDRSGLRAKVRTPDGAFALRSTLIGAHNLDNLLVAAGCLVALDSFSADAIGAALNEALGAPGRLQRIADPRGVAVLVDYAHTPDALANVLDALAPLTEGRLLCVIGCGGDRDRTKRPLMGSAAAARSDALVITSDNPRTEDPRAILEMIIPGAREAGMEEITDEIFRSGARGFTVAPDRRAAIELAIGSAKPGDTVLIAGKGHEDYQIVGNQKLAFDDRLEARRAIERACARETT